MKPLLFVLLAASLAANVVLGLRARRPAESASATATPGAVSATAAAGAPATNGANAPAVEAPRREAASPAPTAPVWKAVASDADMHRMVADLRSAGFPAPVIRAVVNQLLQERFASRQPRAGQPFWKQAAPTPETIAAQNALQQERQALFESLLGADARPSATIDPVHRERRYGSLSDEKLDVVARIERDYNEMTSEMWARRRGNAVSSTENVLQSQQLMEQEKLADLATVLTPDELAQYEMRNSQSARTLMNNLRNVDITEQEYAQLYAAQKAFDTANPARGMMDATVFAQRQTDQLVVHEKARTVLGDERFYAYLEGADRNYATAAQAFSAFPSITPDKTYAVYQLQTELQGVMGQLSRDGPPSPEKMAQMRKTSEAYNAQLEQLVGAEAAAAYRKQGMGRMFGPGVTVPGRTVRAIGR